LLEDFFKIILDLKNVQRKGWIDKIGIKDPESVADHSFSMTLMSMIVSELHGLDTNKIVKMSLLHDLSEANVGDFIPGEISKTKKLELENDAMRKILTELPNELIKNYQDVWDEFLIGKSEESIFVHEMDKLEMAFQAKQYMDEGNSKEKIQPFIDSANNEIKNKNLKEIMNKLF